MTKTKKGYLKAVSSNFSIQILLTMGAASRFQLPKPIGRGLTDRSEV